MTPEQLQAAYFRGLDPVPRSSGQMARHAAGLAEVARQQAERDAQIADESASSMNNWGHEPEDIAAAIRAQFPEETN